MRIIYKEEQHCFVLDPDHTLLLHAAVFECIYEDIKTIKIVYKSMITME